MISTLPISDVEQIVLMLSRFLDPNLSLAIAERRLTLVNGIKHLLDADVFLWASIQKNGCSACHPAQTSVAPSATIIADGGWSNIEQRRYGLKALSDPSFVAFAFTLNLPADEKQPCLTWRRSECIDDVAWESIAKTWMQTGLTHSLFSSHRYPTGPYSSLSFHRSVTRSNFTDRDKAIVQALASSIACLHPKNGCELSDAISPELSCRENQVLSLLLHGKHKRDIARLLTISEHTVGDYVKAIYKHYSVRSHGELQARFLYGTDAFDESVVPSAPH